MATTQTKPLTPSELRKLQDRATRAAAQAQELEDETFLALADVHHAAEVATLKDRLSSAMEDASHIDVSELKDSFSDAVKDLAKAKQDEAAALDLKNHALVIMSRRAFQASIHPDIVGAGKQNISKAGEALGMPYSTIRPYVLAGGALFQQDRAFLLSDPDADDARIVNGSFDDNSRKAQIEKRQRAADRAKAQAELLKQQQAEIDALKQAQAPASDPADLGQDEHHPLHPEHPDNQQDQQQDQQAPAAGQQAPVQAPVQQQQAQAPAAGPSVSDDVLRVARELVRMAKAQRSNDKAAWGKVQPELVKVLGELFPVLVK